MNRRQIERFLTILAAQLGRPARAYVTGAAAGALWGRVRPSLDIDLGLELRSGKDRSWTIVQAAVDRTSQLTGIPASVAEDIDRWGMITLLDYRKSSRLYRRFGKLEVRLLHPATWAIGKLTRRLDPDVRDIVEVLRRLSVPWGKSVRTWGTALRASPASTAQFRFRLNVEAFLTDSGPAIWGKSFEPRAAIAGFHRAAGIVREESRERSTDR